MYQKSKTVMLLNTQLDGFKIYGEPAYILTYLPGVFR